jgi:ribosome biogenesis GTPase
MAAFLFLAGAFELQSLDVLGFGPFFSDQIPDPAGRAFARITAQLRDRYALAGCVAPVGEIRGALRHRANSALDLPAVGDWVLVRDGAEMAAIEQVLERKTAVVRRAAGADVRAQVVAANVDCVFIVTSANRDFNPRRVERYIATVFDSGARPVVVLNKSDLAESLDAMLAELRSVALGGPVIATSAATGHGLDQLRAHIGAGETAALLGSSGVGKSSLANGLLGESRLAVGDIREDDSRGRHTTTTRELVPISTGGLLIDTPGMRELGLWQDADGVETAFADVESFAADCRFRDCAHGAEPGCGIAAALEHGELTEDRVHSYDKLLREQAYVDRKRDVAARAVEQKRWKSITVAMRGRSKLDPKRAFEKKE